MLKYSAVACVMLTALCTRVYAQQVSTGPALQAQAKAFVVKANQEQDYMCDGGRVVHSVLATAEADNRIVPVVLLDGANNPIAQDAWAPASGFRLANKGHGNVNVIFICSN